MAAVCCAVINFRQQSLNRLADDGVTWVDRKAPDGQNLVLALHVSPGSAGDHAGLRSGDVLLEVAGAPITKTTDVPQALQHVRRLEQEWIIGSAAATCTIDTPRDSRRAGAGSIAVLSVRRRPAFICSSACLSTTAVSARLGSVHFYVLCLTSFVLSSFHFTGKLNAFDQVHLLGQHRGGTSRAHHLPALHRGLCRAPPVAANARESSPACIFPRAVLFAALRFGRQRACCAWPPRPSK